MANVRILYAAEALFVGPSPATGAQPSGSIAQLHRVQSVGYDFTNKLQTVEELGVYGFIDKIPIELPTVVLNTQYLCTNVANEQNIGLYVSGDKSALTNILNKTQNEKNYWLRIVPDGISAAGYTGTDGGAVGIGNGVLASYSAEGRVGSLPTASITIDGLDINWTQTTTNIDNPSLNVINGTPLTGSAITIPVASTGLVGQIAALRPNDIQVSIGGAGYGLNNFCAQSFSVSADLSLEPIICLGSKYPTSREIKFPIECKATVEVLVRDMGTGRLANLQCFIPRYNLSMALNLPTCNGTVGNTQVYYGLTGAILESQKFSSTIGPSQTCSLSFSAPLGGPTDVNGLYISGSLV